ncbi:MAG: hemolysin III family protein, partial [Propionibacteriaceae bacterium]
MPHVLDEAPAEVVRQLKPRLRGWLHTAMAPLALAAGIVLVALAPTSAGGAI